MRLLLLYLLGRAAQSDEASDKAAAHRKQLTYFSEQGDMMKLAKYSSLILEEEGEEYRMDNARPNVYHYLGVAMYNLGHLVDASNAFLSAVQMHENDLPSWFHLGHSLLHQWKVIANTNMQRHFLAYSIHCSQPVFVLRLPGQGVCMGI